MTRLPLWARSPEASAALVAVLNDQPESSITRGSWIEGGGVRHYHGKLIARLRRLRSEHLDALYARPWEEVAHKLTAPEHESADALVERLSGQLTETIGDPFLNRRKAA